MYIEKLSAVLLLLPIAVRAAIALINNDNKSASKIFQHELATVQHSEINLTGWFQCPVDTFSTYLYRRRQCPISDIALNLPTRELPVNLEFSLSVFQNISFLGNGEGMMGSVYTAFYNGQKVVIKTSREDLPMSEELEFELKKEIDILQRLDGAHIVKLIGAGYVTCIDALDPNWKGMNPRFRKPFVVLEYLEGGTLADAMGIFSSGPTEDKGPKKTHAGADSIEYVLRRRQFPTLKALKIGREIASALSYIHDLRFKTGLPFRIIHRDLKPGNVMFDGNGTVKLVDFSMATVIEFGPDEKTKINEPYELTGDKGNVRFMAPEVAKREMYNEKVDVYSFGLLLWEMITLMKPYPHLLSYGGSDWRARWFEKVVEEGHRPRIATEWDPQLQDLISSCWDQDPNMRPSASKVHRLLSDIIDRMEINDEGVCPYNKE